MTSYLNLWRSCRRQVEEIANPNAPASSVMQSVKNMYSNFKNLTIGFRLYRRKIEKIVNDIYGGSISREVSCRLIARYSRAWIRRFWRFLALIRTLILLQKNLLWPDLKRILLFLFALSTSKVNDMSNFLYSNGQKIPGEFKSMQTGKYSETTIKKNWLNTEYIII
jgi:hypothetical protein